MFGGSNNSNQGSGTSQSGFNFGANASTTPAGKPAFSFGSTPADGKSLFGSAPAATTTSTTANIAGVPSGTTATPASGNGFNFGGSNTANSGSTGMFGVKPGPNTTSTSTTSGTGLFGSGTTSSGSTGLFGSGSANKGLFGSMGGTTATAASSTPSITTAGTGVFGASSTTPKISSTPAFSLTKTDENKQAQSATSTTSATGGGFLGGAKPGGLFGSSTGSTTLSQPATSVGSTGFSFDTKPALSTEGGLFGSTTTDNKATTDKQVDSKAKPAFSFGAKPEDTKPATTSFSFGAASTTPATATKSEAPKPSFGATTTNTSSDPAKPLFGHPTTANKAAEPTKPLFGAATSDNKSTTPAKPLFGGTATTDSTKPADASKPIFGAASVARPSEPAKPLFGATSTENKNDSSSKFSKDKAPTEAANIAGLKDVAPSTYLKNKSFEAIIAKWTSALAKDTVEFKNHAQDISNWDRILVENGEKISELFSQVVLAEQSQNRIDQVLQYIGRQQDDLETLLEGYEKQASEFLTNLAGPDGLLPVDQEREKAYRLADDLNEKLENLGGNLSSVISEINNVSTDLNQAKEDDALTQIVKILNSHLSSLQWIDSNTNKLQKKLDEIHSLETETRDHVDATRKLFNSSGRF